MTYAALISVPFFISFRALMDNMKGGQNIDVIFAGGSTINIAEENNGDSFTSRAEKHGFNKVSRINGAREHTAIHAKAKKHAKGGAYLSEEFKRGESYLKLQHEVNTSDVPPQDIDVIFLMTGNTDIWSIHKGIITHEDQTKALNKLLRYLQEDYPNAKVVLIPNIEDKHSRKWSAWEQAYQSQQDIANTNPNIYMGPIVIAQANSPEKDRIALMEALADYSSKLLDPNDKKKHAGPSITEVLFNPQTDEIILNVEHDGGKNLSIGRKKNGIQVDVNGTPQKITHAKAYPYRIVLKVSNPEGAIDLKTGDDIRISWPGGSGSISSANIPQTKDGTPLLSLGSTSAKEVDPMEDILFPDITP